MGICRHLPGGVLKCPQLSSENMAWLTDSTAMQVNVLWHCLYHIYHIWFKKVAFNRPCQPTSAVHVGMSAVFTDAVSCFIVSILPCMFQMFTVHSAKLSSLERFEGQCVLQTVFRSSQVRWHECLRSWTMSSALPYSVAALDSKRRTVLWYVMCLMSWLW